jgi:hypothetical protein
VKKNSSEKAPSLQFYPMDWLGDVQLRMCSLEARGLWIDLICVMTRTDKYGYLTVKNENIPVSNLSKITGNNVRTINRLLKELILNGVLREDENGRLHSKRMVKDQRLRDVRKEAGKLGGNPSLVNQTDNQDLNPLVDEKDKQKATPSSSSSASSSYSLKDYKNILAFWNSFKIIQHRESKEITAAIKSTLKTFTRIEVEEAITNYSQVLNSKDCWLTKKWTLIIFLTQKKKNSLETFLNINNPIENYRKYDNGKSQPNTNTKKSERVWYTNAEFLSPSEREEAGLPPL